MDNILRKKGVKHVCETCKDEFEEYLYFENCCNCEDGCDINGNCCKNCNGSGEHTSWVKNECEDCLRTWLIDNG